MNPRSRPGKSTPDSDDLRRILKFLSFSYSSQSGGTCNGPRWTTIRIRVIITVRCFRIQEAHLGASILVLKRLAEAGQRFECRASS